MSDDEYISGEEHHALKSTHSRHSKKVTLPVSYISIAGIVVVVAILSFLGGMAYQKHDDKNMTASKSAFSQNGSSGFFRSGGTRRLGSFGQVTSVSATSITVSSQRTGSSQTFTIDSSTSITENGQTVPASSIQTGDTVLIMASGSSATTASSIVVNPSFGGGFQQQSSSGSATTGGSATVN